MKKRAITTILAVVGVLLSGFAQAQAIEAVYSLKFDSTAMVEGAITQLFEDDALRDSKATLYVHEFGVPGKATHTIVADYDDYVARDKADEARYESHGWSKYMLATQGSRVETAELVTVIKDYGKPRHEAGYLVAFTMQVSDAARYAAALDRLDDAVGNPGVLRLVGIRSGPADVTHAVLVGADDFAAANKYLDKLFASDAYETFASDVGDIRKLLNVAMYRRVGAYGY
ncbi:MAG: hypothetical protein ACR2RD_18605 [Woeseiaceae bacterium]